MKIIITGGGGFVGKNLVRLMKEKGFEMADITVIDKNEKGAAYAAKAGARAVVADLAERGSWEEVFGGQDALIVLHAQISAPDNEPFIRNNVTATANVMEAAKRAGISKVIHFSSAAVLSVRKDDYAKTKQQSEEIVISSGLRHVILRPSLMYGPFDDKNVGWLIKFARIVPLFPIPGNGKYPRQPVYVGDMCRLVLKLADNFPEKDRIYSINGKDIVYFKDMVKAVLGEMGGLRFPVYIPIPIFLFLVRVYGLLLRAPFTPDQIKSLISGDVFPDYPWWEEFNVPVTSFKDGIGEMMKTHSM